MREIEIRFPIWKTRSVGVAEYKITDDLLISISYETKDGRKLYPDKYFMKREEALTYPLQVVRGVDLRIIPISHLKALNPVRT